MARPKSTNRGSVAEIPFNIRITADEKHALELLRDQQVEILRQQGVLAQVSIAAVVRMLVQEAAQKKLGGWPPPGDAEPVVPAADPRQLTIDARISTPAPTPPAKTEPKVASKKAIEVTESTLKSCEDAKVGLTFVPDLVKALGGDVEQVQSSLVDGARAGRWELRPESGMGRLSPEETALCPKNDDGTVLSWVRIIEPVISTPTSTPQELDAEDIRKRLDAAIGKVWSSQSAFGKAIAPHIGLAEASAVSWVSKFRDGSRSAANERLAVIDSILREAGL